MKRTAILFLLICFTGVAFSQGDPVADLFKKYSGKDGFITVNITGDMLKLMAQMEQDKRDTVFQSSLQTINILTVEKSTDKSAPVVDFRAEISNKLDKLVYREMMSVKKADEDVTIMLREQGGIVAEILIIAGGKTDNALIQVKGSILLREMSDFTDNFKVRGFEYLKKPENK
jgi:hypothetical protein